MRKFIYCRRSLVTLLLLCSSVSILPGCSSLSTVHFENFSDSMHKSSSAIDTVLAFNSDWAKESFINNFATDSKSRLSDLKLSCTDDFNWKMQRAPVPLFMTVRQTRECLYELNNALIGYALLLQQLADESLIDQAAFTSLAKNINRNASEAVDAMRLKIPADRVQLLSKASSDAILSYLHYRQRDALRRAIKNNQKNIEKYSTSAITLLDTTGAQVIVFYSEQSGRLIRQWRSADRKNRIRLTGKILVLNERYITVLKTIRELKDFYHALPPANASLAESINSKAKNITALQKLRAITRRLTTLQKSLKRHLEKY